MKSIYVKVELMVDKKVVTTAGLKVEQWTVWKVESMVRKVDWLAICMVDEMVIL